MTQFIIRTHSFDAAHRVMGHIFDDNLIDAHGINHGKCVNFHGHRYDVDIAFAFESTGEVGYEIDFAEIKRRACTWIDDFWDHGTILNPDDVDFIDVCKKQMTKLWTMKLNGGKWCNPSAENISKELFLICEELFADIEGIKVFSIKLYETAKCSVESFPTSITDKERETFKGVIGDDIINYIKRMGVKTYFKK